MKTSWLAEFYRRWHAARGKRVAGSSRPFFLDWVKLLESADFTSAEDQATAAREAEALEKSGHLVLKRHRYRTYLIERVALPLASEPWLIERFGGTASEVLQASSLEIVADFAKREHTRFPVEWAVLCEALRVAFSQGRSLRPFGWSHPGTMRHLLEVVRELSEREWPVGTLIRAASVEIGLDSKELERHQRTFESGLTRLFSTEISLKTLGLTAGDSHVELHGPVCLHFPDGSIHDFDGLTNVLISAADLARCSSISTTAERLLSIENRKTTFRQYAAANQDRRTLITTTSFPTHAFRVLLEKLPASLPHYHFGDTDPAGWQILLKLREATPRWVEPFRMKFRVHDGSCPLTPYDRQLLPKLLAAPLLDDVRAELESIMAHQDRGDFEQETLGPPASGGWPFGE
ncbi:MAG: Wadjet anti-phage system protein JetD domain-containing protein [Verrucomicrobiota bacterium]